MKNTMDAGWFYSRSQVTHYFSTRFSSLVPPKTKVRNPISILRELSKHQWLLFVCGFWARAWDAFDYYSVSMTLTELSTAFDTDNESLSWAMTITMMLRPVGAIISGIFSDRYGRKWPLIVNLALLIVLELVSGFCNTLPQFLGVRSIYGIVMGGIFGPAAATALEDLPYDARGVLSGLFELSSAVGNLLAAALYCALVPRTPHGWRSLYWFGAGPPMFIIVFRWWLPETNYFQIVKAKREAKALQITSSGGSQNTTPVKVFAKDAGKALKENWVLLLYIVFLLAGFASCSHGSTDFYPTFLKSQVQLNTKQTTIITIAGQLGAFFGGVTMGYISSFFGRRLVMITACIFGAALIPAYTLPRNMTLTASSFFQQFFIGGVLGPIPIHLLELSPQAIRSLIVGLVYQLGNLAASATPTIQALIGQRFPLIPAENGMERFGYGIAIAIFMAAGWSYILVFLILGPEMSHEERKKEAEAAMSRGKIISDQLDLAKLEKTGVIEGEAVEWEDKKAKEPAIKCVECSN
ncbi:Carboxylic acid transporter protein homolog [Talaromyces islandicus]|uniref:Carboxylic acid transporter protein homolog n=1 Tax=Talaromyces islandicus TaxID=28573 RepID=A0A0U1M7U3_TALIS|nr:Carboxylic acid transporter protein homolog [Talaromyces islandicus]